ncbi:hypothetical protein [Oceanicoccus sp. KOV_DT_Chl]|uniref:hypothetical protein n=1 Tax=Oceanicoccus sp. KOV_DT_Chl TaxID=1904639 RepID=UPI0011AFA6D5|nr:hypothetical protein [Oceanicoccus sp. KOV_DT_Chl]
MILDSGYQLIDNLLNQQLYIHRVSDGGALAGDATFSGVGVFTSLISAVSTSGLMRSVAVRSGTVFSVSGSGCGISSSAESSSESAESSGNRSSCSS